MNLLKIVQIHVNQTARVMWVICFQFKVNKSAKKDTNPNLSYSASANIYFFFI